jgi:divalent metal cation (Fe/Co/Zn/Cd) transporter
LKEVAEVQNKFVSFAVSTVVVIVLAVAGAEALAHMVNNGFSWPSAGVAAVAFGAIAFMAAWDVTHIVKANQRGEGE